jgi:diphthamide biosynthesis protein 3
MSVCANVQITLDELIDGEDIAHCPSCSLRLRIVYDEEALEAIVDKYGIE